MVGIRFSCGTNNSLCLHALATCEISPVTGGEVCICPPGYQHDFVFPHQPDCGMPTWFLPAFFAVSTVGIVGASITFLNAIKKLSGVTKNVAQNLALLSVIQWLEILCVFLENGSFIWGNIFAGIYSVFLASLAYLAIMMVTAPVYAALKKPLEKWRRVVLFISAFYGIVDMILCLAAIAFHRLEHIEIYNAIIAAALFSVGSSFLILLSILINTTYSLERMIRTVILSNTQNMSVDRERLQIFLRQLGNLKIVAMTLMVNSGLLVVGAVFCALGSIPYFFAFWAVYWSSIWPIAPLAVRALHIQEKAKLSQGSKQDVISRTTNDPRPANNGVFQPTGTPVEPPLEKETLKPTAYSLDEEGVSQDHPSPTSTDLLNQGPPA